MSLLDRIVPRQALTWGRLTTESDAWLSDAVRWCVEHIPATLVRPCPQFSRLDRLMSTGGKSEPDGWTPASFVDWWRT